MKKLFHHFPQILTYDVILAPKLTQFWPFSHKKWPILTKWNPLMTFLTKFMFINLTEIILKTFERKYFLYHPKILAYFVILAPQIDPILTIFHQKLPILTKLTSLMIFMTKVELINLTEMTYNDIQGLLFQK